MPTIYANGIDIWYDLLGSEADPALVLNHGWLGPSKFWKPAVLEGLSRQCRLLLYDVRGQGRTSLPDDPDAYSLPIYARDVAALMDAVGFERAHILGVSQGGMIAAQFAVDFPQRTRSLLLCDSSAGNGVDEGPGGAWERTMQVNLEKMEQWAVEEGLARLIERRIAYDVEHDPHYAEHPEPAEERQARDRQRYFQVTLQTFIGSSRAMRTRPDLTARLPELHMPALVIGGEWDDFFPCSERDHRLLRGSRFVRMRRCAHDSATWRQDAFLKVVTALIADVEAGRDVAGEIEL
jgi:pimeloyl-ACP methyl ester carboxylesterase